MTTGASPSAGCRATLAALEESRWSVLVPIAVAAVPGLIGLGDKSLWLDEAFSASIIRLPTIDLLVYMWRNEQQASPYYLALTDRGHHGSITFLVSPARSTAAWFERHS